MNPQKIKWIIAHSIDQFTKLDAFIAFFALFSISCYFLVLPQYEQNIKIIDTENTELQLDVKKKIKQQNVMAVSSKILVGPPIIEISKSYQYAQVQVLDAKYDPQNRQVQLQLQGAISQLTEATQNLMQYQNLHLFSLSLIQDELTKQPVLNVVWLVQEHSS